jgi:hypothetical protein
MKNLLFLVALNVFTPAFISNAQTSIQWAKCYGGYGAEVPSQIIQATDGGFIVLGSTTADGGEVTGLHGLSDFWVIKTDANGILLWEKCYGGASNDYPTALDFTTDGGYILTGYTYSKNGDVTGIHDTTLGYSANNIDDSTVNISPFDSVAYYLQNNMVGNAIIFLDNINTLAANQMLVDIYISIQDFTDAETVLGNIYPANQDIMDFLFVRNLVCRYGLTDNDSTSQEELLMLQNMAEIGSNSICQSDARGILAFLNGAYYMVDCTMVGQCNDNNERKEMPKIGNDGKLLPWIGNNHPNPFSDWTDIPYYLPPNTNSAFIEIFDVLGNKMDTYPLTVKEIQATLTISSKGYSSGVYIYYMIADGKKAGWKKLMIIK